jgi:hypothetical protein
MGIGSCVFLFFAFLSWNIGSTPTKIVGAFIAFVGVLFFVLSLFSLLISFYRLPIITRISGGEIEYKTFFTSKVEKITPSKINPTPRNTAWWFLRDQLLRLPKPVDKAVEFVHSPGIFGYFYVFDDNAENILRYLNENLGIPPNAE